MYNSIWERRGRKCESEVLHTSRSVKKEQEEVLWVPEQSMAQLCPWNPWRSMVKQTSTCNPWETHVAAGGHSLKEAAERLGFLVAVALQGTRAGPSIPEWLHLTVRTYTGEILEEQTPCGKDPLCEGLYPMAGTTWGRAWGGGCRDEALWADHKPCSSPPHIAGRKEVEKAREKPSLERRVGKEFWGFFLISHYSSLL